MIGIALLLLIAGSILAAVVPTLPTADAILVIVISVLALSLVIWALRNGGRWGGWGNSGRMGN